MVNSLLTAIVRADGDALVMHVGEHPYVVAPSGPVELSSRPLTLEAVAGMLGQLLPAESRHALEELGAIEHELPRTAASNGERFTVVAARGGDDIWIEIRRHRKPVIVASTSGRPERQPELVREPLSGIETIEPAREQVPVPAAAVAAPVENTGGVAAPTLSTPDLPLPVSLPDPPVSPVVELETQPAVAVSAPPAPTVVEPVVAVAAPPTALPVFEALRPAPVKVLPVSEEPVVASPTLTAFEALAVASPTLTAFEAPVVAPPAAPVFEEAVVAPPAAPVFQAPVAAPPAPRVVEAAVVAPPAVVKVPPAGMPPPAAVQPVNLPPAPLAVQAPPAMAARPAPAPVTHAPAAESSPAVVLPLARNPVRLETSSRPPTSARIAGIDRLLRLAAARGANTLYLMSQSRPSVRVDGEIATLEGEPVLTAPEVESLLLDLAPERSREALRNGEGTEWMAEVPDVGRIRCLNFRDHRGPGGIFRMISTRPASVEQLGLSREIQALGAEPEGLILVAGPRASGKSTLIAAFVDLINRTRNDYVITIESQIMFAHEGRGCLISQREVRGNSEELATVTRGSLRENPDVLVIEDLRSPEVVKLALDAVEGGHLVIGAISAHTAASAIARLIDQSPPERRQQVQLTLAEGLRGVVAQVLLHKSSGGRVAARELLLNTAPIANLIAEGRVGQLPLALDSGRKHGMVPLNDSLAAFVQSGVVDVREAYRKAFERQAFLAVLRREGMDTSFVERLA